jgi:transcription initiation factor TFIID subunit 15
MGDIPAQANMISTMITNPGPNQVVPANQDFDIQVQINNLVAGTFTNPDTTYYSAPQQLQGGKVIGHTHVTVQQLKGGINDKQPPDPVTFSFFKGINDAGDGNGGLKAAVAGGLPPGTYRVCTMTAASNHQPVIMPVSADVVLGVRSLLILTLPTGSSTWLSR